MLLLLHGLFSIPYLSKVSKDNNNNSKNHTNENNNKNNDSTTITTTTLVLQKRSGENPMGKVFLTVSNGF